MPRQKRFRLTHKGEILDFHKATREEIDDYLLDEEEQERQNSPGLRHRNYDTIKCRFTYINKRERVIESLEQMKKSEDFKVLKYHTACNTVTEKNVNYTNQVKELNIYENYLKDEKLFFKTDEKKAKKNVKYDGPKYEDNEEEFKDVPLEQTKAINDVSDFRFNKDQTIILYIHGGNKLKLIYSLMTIF